MRTQENDRSWKVQQPSHKYHDRGANLCQDSETQSLTIKYPIASIPSPAAHRPHIQHHHQQHPVQSSHELLRWKTIHLVGRQDRNVLQASDYPIMMFPTSTSMELSNPVMTSSTPISEEPSFPSVYSYSNSMFLQSETTLLIPSYGTRSSNLSSTYSAGRPSSLIYYTTATQSTLSSSAVLSSYTQSPTPPYPTSNFGINGTSRSRSPWTSTTQILASSSSREPWAPLISIILSIASLEASASNHLTLTVTDQALNATSISTLDTITTPVPVTTTIISTATLCDITSSSGPAPGPSSTSGAVVVVVVNSTIQVIPIATSIDAAGSVQTSFIVPSSVIANTSSPLHVQQSTFSNTLTQFPTTFSTSFVSSSTSSISTSSPRSSTTSLVARTSYATHHTASSALTGSSMSITTLPRASTSSVASVTSTAIAIPANSIKSSTPTSTVVGSVVGSVAGFAILLALLLLLLRWLKRHNFAGGQALENGNLPAATNTVPTQGPSSSHTFLPPVAAGLLNRLSLPSVAGRPQSIPPPTRSSDQPAFERLSGRKLPSYFSPGIEGPVSASFHPSVSPAYPSGIQPEMVENPFIDPIPPIAAVAGIGAVGAAAGKGSRRHEASNSESDPDRETLMPSPARTPVLRSVPEGRKSLLAAPGVASVGPGRPLTPSWGVGRGMSGSSSRPETRGSTATLGSRFREDIT